MGISCSRWNKLPDDRMEELYDRCLMLANQQEVFSHKDIRKIYDLWQRNVLGLEDDSWADGGWGLIDGAPTFNIDNSSRGATLAQLREGVPVLKHNPFLGRMFEVFVQSRLPNVSHLQNQTMLFTEFLHLALVFSPLCPADVKVECAFRMYDFTGKQFIDSHDVIRILELLFPDDLFEDPSVKNLRKNNGADWAEFQFRVAKGVMTEADLDGTRTLSLAEFRRLVKRIPQFMRHFQFNVI